MDKSKSFQLFILSFIIIGLTFLIATFWDMLELGANKIPLAISMTITFGISIAGVILGITELKKAKEKKKWIGVIGNMLVLLLFIFMIIFSLKK
ncbi:hypothetical protein [Draconibacterium sediminis]|uniref:Uncharacterized protein n=1 Tax=Draconibacterium sediminis TaxID=1544798 RepID=A0A0D8J580_9BACT|nr:hypothetical protein [Draconibacterium sediminis]KJF42062.1 hypothetical protein LH29_22560 [Draconibacterium sediminis]